MRNGSSAARSGCCSGGSDSQRGPPTEAVICGLRLFPGLLQALGSLPGVALSSCKTVYHRLIKIRKYKRDEARAVSRLISDTFARFCANEGTSEAVHRYVQNYNLKGKSISALRKRFANNPFCFVALDDDRIVGIARRVGNRIVNLLVDGAYHRQGIATRLVRTNDSLPNATLLMIDENFFLASALIFY